MELPKPTELATEIETTSEYLKFWYSKIINKQGEVEWKIDHLKFIEFLRLSGFRRYDINQEYIFIRIDQRVIEEITVHGIMDEVLKYIESIDELHLEIDGITRDELNSKFYTSPAIFFNDKKLSMLGIQQNLIMNADTKEYGFIYYENGFVKCYAGGFEILPYKELDGYVFRNQIKNRKIKKYSSEGMFRQFVFNISGKKDQRFKALQTMIGYLLHSFYETKMKAVNLTDSSISDNAEGRTGKTLLGHAISLIKNVCEISGKDFDPTNKHKYSAAKLDTQIVFLNDLQKRFNFEALFNDISDMITVDQKNRDPFTIRAKMLISSNDTFQIEGASAKDRVIEFELADYYNAKFSPENEFGVWFFRDWDTDEWLKFDNFMIECLTLYFELGVIEADPINLDKRKQIQHTNRDFVEFMDAKIKDNEVRIGGEYNKRILHEEFLENYPEYKNDRWLKMTGNFVKYLKIYAAHSPELKEGKISERKSNGQTFIQFKKVEEKQTDIPF